EVRKGRFTIFSPAFENRGTIPKKYGCEGDNMNPPLKMENVPSEAKSMALIFDDQDAPRGSYVHWILWNIDPRTGEIKENSFPQGAVQGMNDFKKNNYGGPCPPTRPHRYVFNVFALDIVLNLIFNAAKPDLERAMEGHIISQAQLRGTYKRK
ncbi:MAG TPA: YbhB/YbcL family Raf kinase inhibitor-like protein, partial [Thermodesulfobacteriota bacterium]|nr:YbhB/YbcL family Raf kinase inhibitor-like protein [Thermodesulfobacteriota bacterium]